MSSKFRNLISSKSRQLLTTFDDVTEIPTSRQIISKMKIFENKSVSSPFPITFTLPIASLGMGQDPAQISKFIENFETDSNVQSVTRAPSGEQLTFGVNKDFLFSRELAVQLRHEREGYSWIRDGLFPEEESLNVIVDYRKGKNISLTYVAFIFENGCRQGPNSRQAGHLRKVWPFEYRSCLVINNFSTFFKTRWRDLLHLL